jgi:DNA-binding PadR family transcriptional regulator
MRHIFEPSHDPRIRKDYTPEPLPMIAALFGSHDPRIREDDCSRFRFLLAGRLGGRSGSPFGRGGLPPGGFGWPPFRPGPRARRGDIRAAILALLGEEPRNGYQIMQEIKQRSQGTWNPSPGSVYPALQQLEDELLVVNEERPSGRVYALTNEGKAYVKEHADEIAAPWKALTDAAGDDVVEVMSLSRQVVGAAMQLIQAGDSAQIGKAKKILVATRRSLYEILAEGSSED